MSDQNSIQDSRQDVESHLKRLKSALKCPDCNIDLLMKKKGETESSPYSTAYTLQALDYDMDDVKETLLNLQVCNYVETMQDSVKMGTRLYVFGVQIQGRDVYIKEKLRTDRDIFCISFHFARYPFGRMLYEE